MAKYELLELRAYSTPAGLKILGTDFRDARRILEVLVGSRYGAAHKTTYTHITDHINPMREVWYGVTVKTEMPAEELSWWFMRELVNAGWEPFAAMETGSETGLYEFPRYLFRKEKADS